jgi:hypothetical protein
VLLLTFDLSGWCWTTCGKKECDKYDPHATGFTTTIVDEGLTARISNCQFSQYAEGHMLGLVTCDEQMTEGRHHWEVEITDCDLPDSQLVGAARPGLDHDRHWPFDDSLWDTTSIGYFENNFDNGDRVGVLLDLDEGWLRFYLNGVFMEDHTGVTGPLVRAVFLAGNMGADDVTALPGAVAPVFNAIDVVSSRYDIKRYGGSKGEAEADSSGDQGSSPTGPKETKKQKV